MIVKYFKNYEDMHDCYVGESDEGRHEFDFYNIVSITKNDFYLFANDESSFKGLYRILTKVGRRDFENLIKASKGREREKGLEIINKFHKDNPNKNENSASVEGHINYKKFEELFEFYKKANPILE